MWTISGRNLILQKRHKKSKRWNIYSIHCNIFSLQLVSFKKFKSTVDAVEGTTALVEGKLNKTLKKLLKAKVTAAENLAVGDAKLGNLIKVHLSCDDFI